MNMKHIVLTILVLLAALLATPTRGEEEIRSFSGERSKQTGEFEVEAPWILDWRITGEYAREMAVDISLVEAKTNIHQGNVLRARWPGNGVRLFREGGQFYFSVDSQLAGWTLTVKELTEEEAELYTPRNPGAVDY